MLHLDSHIEINHNHKKYKAPIMCHQHQEHYIMMIIITIRIITIWIIWMVIEIVKIVIRIIRIMIICNKINHRIIEI